MKTKITLQKLTAKFRILIPALVLFLFTLNSCYKGYDGRPGDAYLSLSWEISKPYYIDAGPEIPATFRWGEFYYATPGVYYLYYEGEHWNGWRWVDYAWEVEYEIWRVPGEPGGYGYHGYDGPDTYLTLVCNPFGPYEERFDYRSAAVNEMNSDTTGNVIVIEKILNDVGMKITYTKAEPVHKPVK